MSAASFLDDALASFEQAGAKAGINELQMRLATDVARVRFAGGALADLLAPAIEHLRVVATTEVPAFTVGVFDTESTGTPMVPAPWPRDAYGPKGEIRGYNDDRVRTVYSPGIDILETFDRERMIGVYWTPSHRYIPWWERSHPLRTTIHWWTTTTPSLQPVHAGAVGRSDGGVLIAGGSGRGKSTTTLACLDGGLAYAGDDYVLADVDAPAAYSMFSTAKLLPDNVERFPHLRSFVDNADALPEQKAMLFLHRYRPELLAPAFPIRAIVLPRVTGDRSSAVVAATPRDALAAIAPMTMLLLPGYSREAFAKMSRLTDAAPSYWLDAGTDLVELAHTVDDLITKLT